MNNHWLNKLDKIKTKTYFLLCQKLYNYQDWIRKS